MFGLKNYVPTWVTSTANSVVQNNPSSHEIRQNAGYHASSTSTAATNLVADTGGAAYSLASNFSPVGLFNETCAVGARIAGGTGAVFTAYGTLAAVQFGGLATGIPGASAAIGGAMYLTAGVLSAAIAYPVAMPVILGVAPSMWIHRKGIGEAIGYGYNITADTLQTAYHAPSALAANVQTGVVRAAEMLADEEIVNEVIQERAELEENAYAGRDTEIDITYVSTPRAEVLGNRYGFTPINPEIITEYDDSGDSVYTATSTVETESYEFHHILTHEQNDNYDLGAEDFDSCEELVASIQREEALYENPEVTTTDGFASALEAAFARGDVFSDAMEEALGATPTPKGDELSVKEFDLAGDLSEDFGFEVM